MNVVTWYEIANQFVSLLTAHLFFSTLKTISLSSSEIYP